MPWNFPFWQVFRFIAPNLMARQCGTAETRFECSAMLRSSEIEQIMLEAGFPEGAFQTLLIGSQQVDGDS